MLAISGKKGLRSLNGGDVTLHLSHEGFLDAEKAG